MDGFAASRLRLGLPRRSLRAATDERLVAQIRGCDSVAARSAFETLYDRHHSGILAFCRHMLGSAEEAEDAVQHTFSAAYRALVRDDRAISLRAWLYAIARNRCLSVLSARRDQIALDDVEGLLPSTTGLALEVEQRSDLRALLADLQRLPEQQRAALVLAELEAHSHAEIAEILGVPAAKVKALVFQARETLMIRRQARETDCTAIREQLSLLRGGALRRRELRRHVEQCEGCRLFEAEVRRQRASMALLLPVAPTLALKHSSLAAAFTAAGTGAAGAGAVAGGGGGLAAGGLALGVKAISTKVLAAIAVAGSAGGGGYVAVNEVSHHERKPVPAKAAHPRPAAAPRLVRATPAATVVPGTAAVSPAAGVAKSAAKSEPSAGRERAQKDRDPGSGRGPAGIAGPPDPEGSKSGRGRGRGGDGPDKRTPPRGRGGDDPKRGRAPDLAKRDKSSGSSGRGRGSAAKPDDRPRDEPGGTRAEIERRPAVTATERHDDPKSGGPLERAKLPGQDSSGPGPGDIGD